MDQYTKAFWAAVVACFVILVSLSVVVFQIVTPYDKCDVYDAVDRARVETCQ